MVGCVSVRVTGYGRGRRPTEIVCPPPFLPPSSFFQLTRQPFESNIIYFCYTNNKVNEIILKIHLIPYATTFYNWGMHRGNFSSV